MYHLQFKATFNEFIREKMLIFYIHLCGVVSFSRVKQPKKTPSERERSERKETIDTRKEKKLWPFTNDARHTYKLRDKKKWNVCVCAYQNLLRHFDFNMWLWLRRLNENFRSNKTPSCHFFTVPFSLSLALSLRAARCVYGSVGFQSS